MHRRAMRPHPKKKESVRSLRLSQHGDNQPLNVNELPAWRVCGKAVLC